MIGQLHKKRTLADCLSDNGILKNALFILNPGETLQIRECAASGASLLLPNLMMGHSLILQTVLRQAKPKIVLSESLWDTLKHAFESCTIQGSNPELVIYQHLN